MFILLLPSQIDEQLVQSSGKFLILDRLLPALRKRGHKVKQMQSNMSTWKEKRFFSGKLSRNT